MAGIGRTLRLAAAGAAAALAATCGRPPAACNPARCRGCCAADGTCRAPSDQACGTAGAACQDCAREGQVCALDRCSAPWVEADAGPDAGTGREDAGPGDDGGAAEDAGSPDAGPGDDAGAGADAGLDDGGADDGGSGTPDAGAGADAGPTPPDDTCAGATPVSPGRLAGQATVGYANDYDPGASCTGWDEPGRDRVYAVTVPDGQELVALATPNTPSWDFGLYLVAGPASNCTAVPACLAGADVGWSGEPEDLHWTNAGGAAAQAFLVVDAYDPADPGGSFDLDISVAPPKPGDSCAGAEVLAGPGSLPNRTTLGYARDYDPGQSCAGVDLPGRDRVWAIAVPDRKSLTVTVTPPPTSSWDPAVYLVAAPASSCTAAPACLAGSDVNGGGQAESVSWTNTQGAAATVFIVVDTWLDRDPGETFQLDTAITP